MTAQVVACLVIQVFPTELISIRPVLREQVESKLERKRSRMYLYESHLHQGEQPLKIMDMVLKEILTWTKKR